MFLMTTLNAAHPSVKVVAQAIQPVPNVQAGSTTGNSSTLENPGIESTIEGIITQELEEERVMREEEEEARGGDSTVNRKSVPDDLFFQVQRSGDRLVSIASQLVSNKTTNLAECFMNIRCKFDGGKFYNRMMVPKLDKFWNDALLPELAAPEHPFVSLDHGEHHMMKNTLQTD